jgi:hypothetical protein
MPAVAELGPPVSPLLVDGLLRAAAEQSRSRAYELRDAVLAALPWLQRPVGRPPAPTCEASPDKARTLLSTVTTFMMDHPGCVYASSERRRYSNAFRHCLIELRERPPRWSSATARRRSWSRSAR